MRQFIVHAQFDADAGVWWGTNDELPLTTEARTLDELMARILEIAPEVAALNGHVKSGEQVKIHLIADRVAADAP